MESYKAIRIKARRDMTAKNKGKKVHRKRRVSKNIIEEFTEINSTRTIEEKEAEVKCMPRKL